jgi:hypothetical protein
MTALNVLSPTGPKIRWAGAGNGLSMCLLNSASLNCLLGRRGKGEGVLRFDHRAS